MQGAAQPAISKVRCPYCGYEADVSGFRLVKGPWRFRFYAVRMLECPRCRGVFNYYSGVSPRGKRSTFVIRVRPRVSGGQGRAPARGAAVMKR